MKELQFKIKDSTFSSPSEIKKELSGGGNGWVLDMISTRTKMKLLEIRNLVVECKTKKALLVMLISKHRTKFSPNLEFLINGVAKNIVSHI